MYIYYFTLPYELVKTMWTNCGAPDFKGANKEKIGPHNIFFSNFAYSMYILFILSQV